MAIRKAVIPAAGLGIRFLPATKAQPKEMLPLVDKPAIQYIVEEAAASGIESLLIITGRGKRAIEDHFDYAPELEAFLQEKGYRELAEEVHRIPELIPIHYLRQKEPRGLGHAVLCARQFVGEEYFAVMLGDDVIEANPPALRQLMDVHEHTGGSVLAVMRVGEKEVSRYGIVAGEEVEEGLWRVRDLVEKPRPEEAPSNLAVIGRYILSPKVFDILTETKPGAGGEIQLTDALRVLCRKEPLYAYAFRGMRFDIGEKLGYVKATVELALHHPEIGTQFRNYLQRLRETLTQ
ncbi:MAG: UTP--glucose-1-phosphate uridylyltransferase GalU [Candidatus Bipolaricaulota bacterium]|nr:UTP--glucose-1-phosphate uridylyltransferase GalU [Candidatus Bipolaricaulota bacterium]MDW8126448.1 UTP--glucose-1-phosphate uridylyltransferase GalU [Candidatus Bipolaricaulota bacterium]